MGAKIIFNENRLNLIKTDKFILSPIGGELEAYIFSVPLFYFIKKALSRERVGDNHYSQIIKESSYSLSE